MEQDISVPTLKPRQLLTRTLMLLGLSLFFLVMIFAIGAVNDSQLVEGIPSVTVQQ